MGDHVESLMPEIESTETPPELPEANLNTDPPADKHDLRDEGGKYAPKDGKKKGKEPEAKKEPAKEDPKPPEQKTEHTVPVRTLVEERRQWQQEKKALEERLAKLESPPKPPEAPPEDPKAYTDFRLKAALEQLEGKVQKAEQSAQTSQQQTEHMTFVQHLQSAEAAFIQQNPDYYEAVEHVRNFRRAQLQIMAPDAPIDQINAYIGREELQAAAQLAQAGRNPIPVVYEMAKRLGYKRQESADLPDVPDPKKLPPDQTLGTGTTTDTEPKDEQSDPFEDAFAQMFGKRKAS